MEDILLAVMMVGVFVFEYFVVDRFGKFMDENYQWYQEPQIPCRKIYISETKGKNKDTISKEVNTVLNSLSNAAARLNTIIMQAEYILQKVEKCCCLW